MKIWVDADSCPSRVRDVICRAANRVKVETKFVANCVIPFEKNKFTKMIITEDHEGAADDYIAENIKEGDLCVTRDIPLAARLLDLNACVINDRGNQFSDINIRNRLSLRDFMKEMRMSGLAYEKHASFSLKELQNFSSTFDKVLTKLLKQ